MTKYRIDVHKNSVGYSEGKHGLYYSVSIPIDCFGWGKYWSKQKTFGTKKDAEVYIEKQKILDNKVKIEKEKLKSEGLYYD